MKTFQAPCIPYELWGLWMEDPEYGEGAWLQHIHDGAPDGEGGPMVFFHQEDAEARAEKEAEEMGFPVVAVRIPCHEDPDN